eukprot:6471760-Amphidinium_carterae.1
MFDWEISPHGAKTTTTAHVRSDVNKMPKPPACLQDMDGLDVQSYVKQIGYSSNTSSVGDMRTMAHSCCFGFPNDFVSTKVGATTAATPQRQQGRQAAASLFQCSESGSGISSGLPVSLLFSHMESLFCSLGQKQGLCYHATEI